MYPASARQSDRALLAVFEPVPELAGHRTHEMALDATALYVPAAQCDTLPPLLVYPASARQSDKAAWAVATPVPEFAGQLVQLSALFADALNVPAGQADTLPPPPVYPASALQSVKAALAVFVPVPELDGQASQAALDIANDLYVPDKHGDTLVPLPVYPASARQALTAAECAGLCECAGQAAHALPSPW